ncbi:MAG: SpoIIE family protein phosphatase [Deltaproteobacteria bacterium]|nr:SpoIIE family protein phosphatase [Deltaproteobacteria bacterium]
MPKNNDKREIILLVDDNPTNLQVLRQTLKSINCKMLIAKNGESALAIALEDHPDLILLDIMMPGIDGFEVCHRLKSDPSTEDIPVIFLSALGDTEDKVRGLQLGAVDYVSKPFQPDEINARVNTHLTIHRLRREVQNQRDQLEHELEVVSEVQRGLLPKRLPVIKGIDLAVYYATSRYAGGDYYDIIEIPDNRWGILIADAEGHSAPAAVLMAMTCSLFHSYSGSLTEPAEVLTYINRILCKFADPSFVTALYAVFDAHHRTLKFARAGHPPPMIYRQAEKKSLELVSEAVYPMGIYPYNQVPVAETKLGPGDRLLFYTDGIPERFNNEGKAYGEERLLKLIAENRTDNPQRILDNIIEDLERFAGDRPPDDDQALVLGVVE